MTKVTRVAAAAALMVLATAPLQAGPTLIATGTLTGNGQPNGQNRDLSGLGGTTLENGLPGDILGGLGSGLAYAGGNSFYALPDRGPNATPYNSLVDDTVSYINRYQSVTLALTPNAAGAALPFALNPVLTGTTLLYSPTALNYGSGAGLGNRADGTPIGSGAPALNSAGHYYFTGRSDNFGTGNSGNAMDARFDPESIRVANDGKSVFISDEYGPYIRQFSTTGALLRTYTLPTNLDVAVKSSQGAVEIAGNTSGRVANKGMEGLAITPDGTTLVGIIQNALIQDNSKMLRIVTVDVASGATHEYAYPLTTGSGVSEIVAINNHQFLVDERDGKGLGDGSTAVVKQLFLIDTNGATDVSNVTKLTSSSPTVSKSTTPFLDIVSALTAAGIPATQIPAKIEGLAFGQDVTLNGVTTHTLFVANDNDFVPATSGTNQYFVFGFTDADLPGYVAQAISGAPEPGTWGMMILGFGLAGAMLRRRQRGAAALA